ncbi:hypothetical protein FACS1894176_09920 [Bacteroidia bacterium]|nr:hypothetical protein FACS1894176_09920 [Bacteroidia bacterium]
MMEYVDGPTLYTLQLEATIKRMIKKVETTAMYSWKEIENEQLETFTKNRSGAKTKKLNGEITRLKGNLSSAEIVYKRLPDAMREKAIAKARDEYEVEIKKKTQEIKAEFSLRGASFKAKKEEYLSKIQQQYLQLKETFDEYRETLLRKQVDFVDDNQSFSQYTTMRETYLRIMEECKPILKSSPRRFPDVYSSNMNKQSQSAMTSEFLRFMQEENLPIFSAEDRKKIASRITTTLDIFHKRHFYHRDLGENPRNLMFKRENGEYIPYIIDFGLATEDAHYQE